MTQPLQVPASPDSSADVLEQTRRRLRESEALYRAMVERTPGVTYLSTLDPACPVTYVSPQINTLLGYSPDDVAATPSLWVNAVHPDDRGRVLRGLAETQRTGAIFCQEYRLLSKSGEIVWVQDDARLVRDADGSPLCLQGIMVDISDRKRAEHALQQANSMLSALIEASPMPIMSLDYQRRVLSWNPAAERAYGWKASDVLGKPLPIVPPGLEAELERFHSTVFAGGLPTMETRRLRRDGTIVDAIISAAPVRDAEGRIVGSMSVHVDITARKLAEEQLRHSEEQFRTVLENALDTVILLEPDGTISYVNSAVRTVIGYEPQAVLGRSIFEFLDPNEVDAARATFQKIKSPPHEVHLIEIRTRAADGAYLMLEVSARGLVEQGELRGLILNARDITARRDAERRAVAEHAFRHAMEDSLLDAGVGTIDLDGRQTYVNEALADMLGWPAEELVGHLPPFPYWAPETASRLTATIAALQGGEPCKPFEVPFVRRDGTRVDVLLVPSAMHDLDGRQTGWLAVCYDLTERKQLEAQVRESQKMEAIGRLAGGVAHDFNNLLTAILGYSEFVQQQVAGTPTADDVAQIRQAAESAARLTQQLLAFSRKQVLDPVLLDVSAVVADMQKMLRRVLGEDVELRPSVDAALPPVLADRGQLEQIIMNLAVNARDAMPDGGVLRLSTSRMQLTEPRGEVPTGCYVRLSVADTGCGMDAHTMAHIFEPFFTTKGPGKGTGLGLATVYGIVKQSGGHLDVTSLPGEGARFDIYLPVAGGVNDYAETNDAVRQSGSGTVLVVEDELAVRHLVRRTLEGAGYTVLTADPDSAAAVVRSYKGKIDVFLLDVVMPVKCGPEVAGDLRAVRPDAQVLYMTGYTEHAVLERMSESERARILHKPFANALLLEAVRDVIHKGPAPT